MAAMHAALMSVLTAGSRVVAHRELYGSAWDLLHNFLSKLSIRTDFVDLDDPEARARALGSGDVAVVYCESISNPTMRVSDLPSIAQSARAAGALLVVDATFATPVLQRPLELGADLVVHSATKYLAGHSVGGVVCGSAARLRPVHRWLQLAGGCMDPHAAFLLDRGLKTLPLRMRAHCENAAKLAAWLEGQRAVERVLYPGLASHPSFGKTSQLLAAPGGMLSFAMRGGDEAALRFVRSLELALEASSLGGVETLVSLPFNTSHARLSAEERSASGILPGLVRVSVGIEDVADLVDDFARALAAAGRG
jgi:cystathionine beta-lyase/cystathionine gamma-synthase